MLLQNKRGNYSFLKGISPYSAGVAAAAGFEIVRARLATARPLGDGFEVVARHLADAGRPRQALCGMELRSPRPFTFQGFTDFNAGYVNVLRSWEILLDKVNPVARTNVAPEMEAPADPVLYAFSYTAPAAGAPATFVVAGGGELPEGSLDPHDVVRRGETSADALAEKARFVMGLMEGRLRGLGVDWTSVTATDVYTVHNIFPLLRPELLARMHGAARHGLTWHYARPPIVSIEFEMDVRGCRREIVLTG
jgi:hypothetical protein